MKLYLCITLLILSSASFATKTADRKLKEQETENALVQIKAQQVEEKLSDSDLLKACKENKQKIQDIEECIKSKFDEEGVVEEFADRVDLKSFDINASKNSTTIRKYLSERLRKALYGEPKKGKMQKLVDHEVYSKLYRSQIGKNILMDVSNYCIVNLGIKSNPYAVINHCILDKDDKMSGETCFNTQKIKTNTGDVPVDLSLALINFDKSNFKDTPSFSEAHDNQQIKREFSSDNFKVILDKDISIKDVKKSGSNQVKFSRKMKNFWKDNAYEYELNEACIKENLEGDGKACRIKYTKSDGTVDHKYVRNASFLNAVKELEFKLGPQYMKEKYQFCAFTAIQNMCEVYKCRNVYFGSNLEEEKMQKCIDLGFAKATIEGRTSEVNPITDHTGSIACSLMAKLKQYRQNIATLDVIDEYNKGLKVKKGLVDGKRRDGNHIAVYQGGSYGYGNSDNEKSIEEITTISSDELAGKSELGMSEEELDALRQECLSDSGSLSEEEKCQQLISDLGEDATNVTAELESETQLYLKRIEAIQADDKETIKQYLIKHGLSKHIAALEGGTLDTSILKKLIADEYKSEREALKKSMMDKFNRLTKKDDDPAAPAAASTSDELTDAELATENIENIAKQKETIQTLFQYNNVISSYMSAKVGEGEDAEETELSYQRDIELQGMSEFGEEETKAKAEEYTKMFEDENARESSGNEQMNVDLNFIDSLLGNKEDKKKTP